MRYLADTNILLRLIDPASPMHATALSALTKLRNSGETVWVTPQNLVEFWNGATRPAAANGLGLTPAHAALEMAQIEAIFPLAEDNAAIHPEWRMLVANAGVSGVQVHDARLAAAMRVHGLTHLLTFNIRDFGRYPGITLVHPNSV
ncbi:MAG: type II toxin-antitoxin system VapC family toxin [Capsulimonas sp.]|uniref:type II toxin-antitoxin system VapC family toxin n=1 Tax=Capsulimonas sp. TaxID=2494211 RepID=UPI003267B8C2